MGLESFLVLSCLNEKAGSPRRRRPLGPREPIADTLLLLTDALARAMMTRDRLMQQHSLSHGSAVAMIHERRGTMYDADIADAFLRIVHGLRSGAAQGGAARPQTGATTPWLEAKAG